MVSNATSPLLTSHRSTAALAFLAGLVVACELAPGVTTGRDGAAKTTDTVISLLPYFRDLRVVRVQLGRDSATFLLDTGGGATLISPEVARRQGCTPHGADVGYRMTGEPVTFARCDSLRLTSGSWSTSLTPVAVFDVNALLPAELPRVDGVLAMDAFRGQVVTLDWPAGTLTLQGSATADSAARQSGVVVRWATGESGRFLTALVQVAGSREPLWFLLDSGNLRGTLVATSVLRDSLLPLQTGNEALMAIGGRTPVSFLFSAAELIVDGALGTDYLQRGAVTLDLRNLHYRAAP